MRIKTDSVDMVHRPPDGPRITAVLGPTNTGKTHLAVERMLSHRSGLIGFPLRLLAREIYDKVVAAKGEDAVALVTGEEKRIPPGARYFLCTVESMPLDRRVDFLAVDEIQLAGDRERGHVFTDRLLHARGQWETMFLGAETIRPRLRDLVPDAAMIARPRYSDLAYAGHKKLTRLKPRSAVIAFSAEAVYSLAEVMRTHRGGCAVVLGALSPRTRNAQVGMYQSGEIDYMVATDAIGMGLNMDLDHVAFSADVKFDGRNPRRLRNAELAQIAGRAGRYVKNGTFGTTGDLAPFDADVVEAIENHQFPAVREIYWRNSALRFRSIHSLLSSLEAPPPAPGLRRVRGAVDHLTLQALARDPEVERLATSSDAVRLLWEVCQIPDFRKTLADAHVRLAREIFLQLVHSDRLPSDWVARMIARLEQTDGDIDTLTTRISHIRTWTYVSHHPGWLENAERWQERTRAIEDKLSDALHERLTQRFVDRRAAVLVRRLRESADLLASVNETGEVLVEGHYVGRIRGFRFEADATGAGERSVLAAAHRVLSGEFARRTARLEGEADQAFSLGLEGASEGGDHSDWAVIRWRGEPVAKLVAGDSALKPGLQLLDTQHLTGPQRERIRRRIAKWLDERIARLAAPLVRLEATSLKGTARGLAYQLWESLGCIPRYRVKAQVSSLSKSERARMGELDIRIGTLSVYVAPMLKPARMRLSALLWCVVHGLDRPPFLPQTTSVSFPRRDEVPRDYYAALGYVTLGPRVLRADVAERLAGALRKRARNGAFLVDRPLLILAGCKREAFADLARALGYVMADPGPDGAVRYVRAQRTKAKGSNGSAKRGRRKKVGADVDPDSPFAKLRGLGSQPVTLP